MVAPEQVGETIAGHDAVDVQQQDREQRSLDRAAGCDCAIAVDHLERAEYPEIEQAAPLACVGRS